MRLLTEFQINLLNEMGNLIFQTWSDNWIDFSQQKKGQLGKKILFFVLQVYNFFFFFFTIVNKRLP